MLLTYFFNIIKLLVVKVNAICYNNTDKMWMLNTNFN